MSTDLKQEAQRIIGKGEDSDYVITPTKHADSFAKDAPDFAQTLCAGRVGIAAKDYEEKNQAAIDAQVDFQKVFRMSNMTVFFTSTIITLVLLTGILFPDFKIVMVSLGLLSFVSGFVASYYLNVLKQGRLLDQWMSNRARAEAARLDYLLCYGGQVRGHLIDRAVNGLAQAGVLSSLSARCADWLLRPDGEEKYEGSSPGFEMEQYRRGRCRYHYGFCGFYQRIY